MTPEPDNDLIRLRERVNQLTEREARSRRQFVDDQLRLEERLRSQAAIIADRGQRIDQLESEREMAQSRIQALKASLSWKLTAPLRFLRRRLLDPWRRK